MPAGALYRVEIIPAAPQVALQFFEQAAREGWSVISAAPMRVAFGSPIATPGSPPGGQVGDGLYCLFVRTQAAAPDAAALAEAPPRAA